MTREESKALVGQRRAAARYLEAIARRGEVLARPHWCGREYAKADAVVQRASARVAAAGQRVLAALGA